MLSGFLRLRLLDARGNILGVPPTHDTNLAPGAGAVRLAPGDRARFLYQWGSNPVAGQPCTPATAVDLGTSSLPPHRRLRAVTANGTVIAPCGNGTTFISPVGRPQ
ncbi:MAG: hypothetical protein QOE44_2262 [Solirubrobacteraceae bacterium]|nr:hypothetical protein [Solirubrobacteraceae bacterium]